MAEAPSTTDLIEVRSPHDNVVVGSAPLGDARDIDRAVAAARVAFDAGPWPRMTVAERCAALQPLVDAYGARVEEMSR